MNIFNIRLDLTVEEFEILKTYLELEKMKKNEGTETLIEKIENPKKIDYSFKKHTAMEKATKARTNKAKEKIENAINILRLENKKITAYAIAKMGNVSYNTVTKNIDEKTFITLNEI